MPNQEPASAWIFGNSSVRVGTQGLFHPYLKTLFPPFLPTRLTASGSPRMQLDPILHSWLNNNNYYLLFIRRKIAFKYLIYCAQNITWVRTSNIRIHTGNIRVHTSNIRVKSKKDDSKQGHKHRKKEREKEKKEKERRKERRTRTRKGEKKKIGKK